MAYVTPTLRNSQVRKKELAELYRHMDRRNIETVYLKTDIPGLLSFAFHGVIYCMLGLLISRHEFCSDFGYGIYSLVLDVLSPLFLVFSTTCALWYMQRELLFMESCAYPDLPLSSLCCHDGKMLLKFPNMFLSFLSLIFFRGLLFHSIFQET
jgi:hypothetical protein